MSYYHSRPEDISPYTMVLDKVLPDHVEPLSISPPSLQNHYEPHHRQNNVGDWNDLSHYNLPYQLSTNPVLWNGDCASEISALHEVTAMNSIQHLPYPNSINIASEMAPLSKYQTMAAYPGHLPPWYHHNVPRDSRNPEFAPLLQQDNCVGDTSRDEQRQQQMRPHAASTPTKPISLLIPQFNQATKPVQDTMASKLMPPPPVPKHTRPPPVQRHQSSPRPTYCGDSSCWPINTDPSLQTHTTLSGPPQWRMSVAVGRSDVDLTYGVSLSPTNMIGLPCGTVVEMAHRYPKDCRKE